MTSLDCGAFPPLLFFLLNVPKLVPKRVRVHKPDAQAKDTPLCETSSRNKTLREWFEQMTKGGSVGRCSRPITRRRCQTAK